MKRLPNNYGTVYRLSGNRRKPWIARKMIGKSPDLDRQRMKVEYFTIGYYKTRSEALQALSEYNSEPSDHSLKRKTFADVYKLWSAEYFPKLKTTVHYERAFRDLSGIADMPIADIKLDDVQFVMKASGKKAAALKNVKLVAHLVFKYAAIHEIVPQRKAEMMKYLDVGEATPKKEKRIFTPEERAAARTGEEPIDKVTFFLLCTGLRVGEFCALKNCDIVDGTICIRKAKTKAGIRTIPLPDGLSVPPRDMPYFAIYNGMVEKYGHSPHEARHTFTTLAVEAGIDQRVIDAIVGHTQPGNISLSVYTHITPEAMKGAMNRIMEMC